MSDERIRAPHDVAFGEMPELARALRALGSSRKSGGSWQSQFFFPLIDARRRAADARTPAGRVRAFSVTDLLRALERDIERIVAEWPDSRDAARRALRADLLERVSPYATALEALASRADGLLDAEGEEQVETWRAWTTQLAATFDAADRSWMALRPVVDSLTVRLKPQR